MRLRNTSLQECDTHPQIQLLTAVRLRAYLRHVDSALGQDPHGTGRGHHWDHAVGALAAESNIGGLDE